MFQSLLSTVTLFIEQDPFLHVPMSLDVNYCRVCQENFTKEGGKNIKEEIFTENGDTFQNSPIHLLFYEKIRRQDIRGELSKISSMSFCQFKKKSGISVQPPAYDVELVLLLKDFTAQFVTKEQYQQLLFILGQNQNKNSILLELSKLLKKS